MSLLRLDLELSVHPRWLEIDILSTFFVPQSNCGSSCIEANSTESTGGAVFPISSVPEHLPPREDESLFESDGLLLSRPVLGVMASVSAGSHDAVTSEPFGERRQSLSVPKEITQHGSASWKMCWSLFKLIFSRRLPAAAVSEVLVGVATNPDPDIVFKMSHLLTLCAEDFPVLSVASIILAYVRERHVVKSLGNILHFYSTLDPGRCEVNLSVGDQLGSASSRSRRGQNSPPRSPEQLAQAYRKRMLQNDTVLTLGTIEWRGALLPLISIWASAEDDSDGSAGALNVLNSLVASIGGTAAAIDEVEIALGVVCSSTCPLHIRLARLATETPNCSASIRSFCILQLFRLNLFDRVADSVLQCPRPEVACAIEENVRASANAFWLIPKLRLIMMDPQQDCEVRCFAAWLRHHIDVIDQNFFEEVLRIPTFPIAFPVGAAVPKQIRKAILCHWTGPHQRVSHLTDRRWLLEGALCLFQQGRSLEHEMAKRGTLPVNHPEGFTKTRAALVRATEKRGICIEEIKDKQEDRFGCAMYSDRMGPISWSCKCRMKASSSVSTVILSVSPLGPFAQVGPQARVDPLIVRTEQERSSAACEGPLPSVQEAELLIDQAVREIGLEVVSSRILTQKFLRLYVPSAGGQVAERTVGELLLFTEMKD